MVFSSVMSLVSSASTLSLTSPELDLKFPFMLLDSGLWSDPPNPDSPDAKYSVCQKVWMVNSFSENNRFQKWSYRGSRGGCKGKCWSLVRTTRPWFTRCQISTLPKSPIFFFRKTIEKICRDHTSGWMRFSLLTGFRDDYIAHFLK